MPAVIIRSSRCMAILSARNAKCRPSAVKEYPQMSNVVLFQGRAARGSAFSASRRDERGCSPLIRQRQNAAKEYPQMSKIIVTRVYERLGPLTKLNQIGRRL